MSNIDKQTLRIPERKKHNWGQAVMRDCDFCQQWALTVRHSDGGCICASCCDSEYTTALSIALVVALDELEAVQKTSAARLGAIDTTHKMFQRERDRAEAAEKRIAELGGHLKSAHAFIENTEAFGHEAASGILKCGDSEWNVDASKESLAAAGITVKGE